MSWFVATEQSPVPKPTASADELDIAAPGERTPGSNADEAVVEQWLLGHVYQGNPRALAAARRMIAAFAGSADAGEQAWPSERQLDAAFRAMYTNIFRSQAKYQEEAARLALHACLDLGGEVDWLIALYDWAHQHVYRRNRRCLADAVDLARRLSRYEPGVVDRFKALCVQRLRLQRAPQAVCETLRELGMDP